LVLKFCFESRVFILKVVTSARGVRNIKIEEFLLKTDSGYPKDAVVT